MEKFKSQLLQRETLPPDVLVAVGEYPSTAFLSHSTLLAQQSLYFQNSLTINPFSRVIHLPTVNVQAFSYIFSYFYTNYLALNQLNVQEILRTANYLHIPSVIGLCEAFLANTAQAKKSSWKIESITSNFQEQSEENSAEQRERSEPNFDLNLTFQQNQTSDEDTNNLQRGTSDIAYCDGPIKFQKIPNYHCSEGGSTRKAIARATEPSTAKQRRVRYICHFCDKRFMTKVSFLKHLEIHKSGTEGTSNRESNGVNFQYYKCKLCDSKFPSYYFVHKHRKRFHKED